MKSNKLEIGLFGFGCVGSGLYEVFQKTPTLQAGIKKICVKNPTKKRTLPDSYFTFNKADILNDETINVVVELIDDADAAYDIVKEALSKGKHVVTANKKLLATHFKELVDLAKEKNVSLLYEAAVGGSIPIIRTLEEYYNNDTLEQIEGILNGTTNYILTKTLLEEKSYDEVLKQAQQLGFAESNPTMDVQAFDPKFKLIILVAHAFGVILKPDDVFNYGIERLSTNDILFAKQRNLAIKLIATATIVNGKLRAYVLPKYVKREEAFYAVNNEFNAVQVSAAFSDKQVLTGKGAGSFPTAAAVLSDIAALRYEYAYEYHKFKSGNKVAINNDVLVNIYLRYANSSVFEQLDFETVSEEFRSDNYKYIIGSIKLSVLIKADLLNRTDLFVAIVDGLYEAVNEKQPQQLLASIH